MVIGHVYTVDAAFNEAEAIVIDSGKIIASGTLIDLKNTYEVDSVSDFTGQYIYPGFIDAHAHFYGLGLTLQIADLSGTRSWQEVLNRLKLFDSIHHPEVLFGRGWDQNDWPGKEYPDPEALNNVFPNKPVILKRIDGHAAIANDAAYRRAGIAASENVIGGEFLKDKNGRLTGVAIDNAVDLLLKILPAPEPPTIEKSILLAQDACLPYGLTAIHEAGIGLDTLNAYQSLIRQGKLAMRIYAMLANSSKSLDFVKTHEPILEPRLVVRSMKFYADGALGSRGALLKEPYSDEPGHVGFMLTPWKELTEAFAVLKKHGWQAAVHAIGDKAVWEVLQFMHKAGVDSSDRWRIEHAQVVDPEDFRLFTNYHIIPSVQPTHATSDMPWAESRLGKKRMAGAYAYQHLLKTIGWLPLGTDFPVENINPMLTFCAAVFRTDSLEQPPNGFQFHDALTREQTLRGMTIWAARAGFMENTTGSIEPGKWADFVVMPVDLMHAKQQEIRGGKVTVTVIAGKIVYAAN